MKSYQLSEPRILWGEGVDSVEAGQIKSRELAASAILGRKYFEIYDST